MLLILLRRWLLCLCVGVPLLRLEALGEKLLIRSCGHRSRFWLWCRRLSLSLSSIVEVVLLIWARQTCDRP